MEDLVGHRRLDCKRSTGDDMKLTLQRLLQGLIDNLIYSAPLIGVYVPPRRLRSSGD
jgi:hypothetical protein